MELSKPTPMSGTQAPNGPQVPTDGTRGSATNQIRSQQPMFNFRATNKNHFLAEFPGEEAQARKTRKGAVRIQSKWRGNFNSLPIP
jgi:hypothetical protein